MGIERFRETGREAIELFKKNSKTNAGRLVFAGTLGFGAVGGIGLAKVAEAVGNNRHPHYEMPSQVLLEPPVIGPMQAPFGEHSIFTAPTNSVVFIKEQLATYNSPMLQEPGAVERVYEYMRRLGINPSVGFAVYIHESQAGTQGVASETRNFGNIRHGNRPAYDREIARLRSDPRFADVIKAVSFVPYYNKGDKNDDFRDYASWEDAATDFANLMEMMLITRGEGYTIEDIIPVYAPASQNNVRAYIGDVVGRLADWDTKEHGQNP